MPILTGQETEDNSLDARIARMGARVRMEAAQNYATLCEIQKRGIRLVWENDQGLTPQQVCDAMGGGPDGAAKSFAMHGVLTQAIVSLATLDGSPPDILLPTFAFTANADGTVTVLDTPYVP